MATKRNQNEGQVKGNLVDGWRAGHNQYSTKLVHQSTANQMGGFKTELLTGSAVIPVSQPPQLLASGCQAQCQGVKQWAEFMLLKSSKILFYYRGWFIIILFFHETANILCQFFGIYNHKKWSLKKHKRQAGKTRFYWLEKWLQPGGSCQLSHVNTRSLLSHPILKVVVERN